MKWILSGVIWAVVLAASFVRADPPGDLFIKGSGQLQQGDFANAAATLDSIITDYPTMSNLDEVRLEAGLAYIHLGNYDKAIDRLSTETLPKAPATDRAAALYYTGEAQLLKGGALTDENARKGAMSQAIATMTQLITSIGPAPTADNRDYLESGYYYRALAYSYIDDLASAEKDASQLLQQFGTSLQRPDYLLLLGNLYAQQASEAARDQKPAEVVRTAVDKAIQQFDQAIQDPNALIQANDANLAKGGVLYLEAELTPSDPAGFQKALDVFRQVKRKADLVLFQQANLDAIRQKGQLALQAGQGAGVATANSRIIDRETSRLDTLKNAPDPIIEALIRMAQCYNSMQEGDEARTILHRLAKAALDPQQQEQVDFAQVYSYVLSHQPAKADEALTSFLAKHPGDAQADGISVQIASELMSSGDAKGALDAANRSLSDFPKGRNMAAAIQLKVQALNTLGRPKEAQQVSDDYLKANSQSSAGIELALLEAQRQTAAGDLTGALASYQKVRDSAATPEIQASADAGYIQVLESLGRLDQVLQESQAFQTKYPTSAALASVLVMRGVAMDQKHDPGAIAALQDEARKFPADVPNSPSPFALYYIVTIYQRTNQVPQMVAAADALRKAFPTQYTYLLQAADAVSAEYLKEKKFDLAANQYGELADSSQPDVAALAEGKIGDVWLAAAKAMGPYQSMQQAADRAEAEKRVSTAEQSFITVLRNHADQLPAVDVAFRGLNDALVQRRSWGLLKQSDFETYLTKLTSGLTDPDMQVRVELAKAGLIFLDKRGEKQYPAALARFRAAISAHPDLKLTRTEADRYGELLLGAKDYPTAIQVYTDLLQNGSKDQEVEADGYYGLGATYLAQGNFDQAKDFFTKMKALPGGASWSPHINDANYGLALASEQGGQPDDIAAAKATYGQLMQAQDASVDLQAKATLGYGRMLAKEGHGTVPAVPGTIESGIHYFQQVDTIFGPAVPELSAEGLYDAGQALDQAGDKANAKKQYLDLVSKYKATAPDWAEKATAAAAQD